jgi:phenylalanine-4-hydroxylase
MDRIRPLVQQYDNYTPEDFKVWETLFTRQMIFFGQYAGEAYLEALEIIGFHAGDIPQFADINQKLSQLTGWKLVVVPEIVPAKEFFQLLAEKKFPATCWLRRFSELDYIEEPDMFHDVLGHVPLLSNLQYAEFMQAFGQLALQWIDEPEILELLTRLYWFTVEFGLIDENGKAKIYGAGILSSPGETQFSMGDKARKSKFDTAKILATAFQTDIIQEQYFIIDSISQLTAILPDVEKIITLKRKGILQPL